MASCTIDVYVKLPSGKAVCSQHLPTDTVRRIAEKVAEEEKISENRIRLKYQGKTLDKTKTIGYLGIRPETILKAEVVFPRDINVIVQLPDGRCEPITVKNIDTVSTLKARIDSAQPLPPHRQVLKIKGGQTISGDANLLYDVGVLDETQVIVMEQKPAITDQPTDNSAVSEEVDEEKKMELINTFDAAGRSVEVVFCFDTTGSMYRCLATVRKKLRETCTRLLSDISNIRIGMMANGDYCDFEKYVVCSLDLTTDIDRVVNFAESVEATGGGGNGGEAYEWALRKAQQLDWSEDSAKALIMIGDELPHPPSYTDQNLFWKDEVDILAGMGVKVYGVQALNSSCSTPFYEELAARTGGFYLQLKDFNLITDMFLAVCYREADQSHLDAFVEEVEKEGRMTENTKLFLEKLEEDKPCSPSVAQRDERYIAQEWWDPSLRKENNRPQYKYDQENDSWLPNNSRYSYAPPVTTTGSTSARSSISLSTSTSTSRKTSKLRRLLRSLFRRD